MATYTVDDCFLEIKNGANIKQGEIDGGYPITRIETLSDDKFNRDRMGYAGITDISKYRSFVLEDGDLLMSHINSPKYLGRTVMYKKQGDEVIIHGMNLLRLRARTELILPSYAEFLFRSLNVKEQITKIMKKSVNQASFSVSDLKKIKLSVPTIEVQRKIIQQLVKVRAIVALRLAQLEEHDKLIKARFVEMFGDPVSNPMGWVMRPLEDCLESIENGKSFVCTNEARTGDFPAILKLSAATYGEYRPNENKAMLDEAMFVASAEVHAGDLLFTRKNTPELVGMCAYVTNTPPKLMMPDLLFRLNTKEDCNKIFLWKLINHELFRNCIKGIATGSAKSMSNISKERLGKIRIILPPILEQEQFASFVTQVDKSKVVVQKALDEAQMLFDSLMQEYLG